MVREQGIEWKNGRRYRLGRLSKGCEERVGYGWEEEKLGGKCCFMLSGGQRPLTCSAQLYRNKR